jgi:hypothetical protein
MGGMDCLKEYQLRVIRQIRIPQRVTPDYFAVGGGLHAGKARWFSRGFATDAKTWASIQIAMREEMENQKLPVTVKALQMMEKYMKEYIDHWGRLPKPTPIACEYKLGPTPLEAGDPFFMHRTARLDDVSRYPNGLNKLYLGETKTTSGSIGQCIEQYALHPQILLQMLLWKMDPKGEATYGPIEGVMLDVIKKGYGEESCSFAREAIPVPAFAMSWFPRTLKAWLRIFAAIDWDADVTRNPMRCTRSIGRATVACEFRELCKKGRAASNLYVMGKGVQLLKHEPEPGKMRMPWE